MLRAIGIVAAFVCGFVAARYLLTVLVPPPAPREAEGADSSDWAVVLGVGLAESRQEKSATEPLGGEAVVTQDSLRLAEATPAPWFPGVEGALLRTGSAASPAIFMSEWAAHRPPPRRGSPERAAYDVRQQAMRRKRELAVKEVFRLAGRSGYLQELYSSDSVFQLAQSFGSKLRVGHVGRDFVPSASPEASLAAAIGARPLGPRARAKALALLAAWERRRQVLIREISDRLALLASDKQYDSGRGAFLLKDGELNIVRRESSPELGSVLDSIADLNAAMLLRTRAIAFGDKK